MKTPKINQATAPQPERANITRAEANKILTMVQQRVADAPEDLITYCLRITGDITGATA